MSIASYAKINLHLEVIRKLPNNYHQVNTVFCSIDLCDYLSFELLPESEIILSCSEHALENHDNLVFKIASYLQDSYRVTKGVKIHLEKRIPVAAGLGGGSSNAACCLAQLNNLWRLALPAYELNRIAALFGSDLNFFLVGGTALGTNRGELIMPLPGLNIRNILLVNPGIMISSSEAYNLVQIPELEQQRQFVLERWEESCFNRLESAIRKRYPSIDQILNTLNEYGAKPAIMSGSGSTCFGVFTDVKKLDTCKKLFDREGFWTYIAHSV